MKLFNFRAKKEEEKIVGKIGWLLGFRSNKFWKKVLSSLYLFSTVFGFASILFEGKATYVSMNDFLIDKATTIILLLISISPYIFLSNTKLREKLPFFKEHKKKASFLGMVVVFLVLTVAFVIVNCGYSEEYLAHTEGHIYIEVETVAPTCENEGEKTYECEYCGERKSEVLLKIGEHNFVEILREEPTVETEGKITTRCTVCGKEEVKIIEKLPVSIIEGGEIDESQNTVFAQGSEVEVKEPEQKTQTNAQPQNNKTNDVIVYDTPTGKRYHYSRSCAGKNAFETTLERVTRNGKTPCKQCA